MGKRFKRIVIQSIDSAKMKNEMKITELRTIDLILKENERVPSLETSMANVQPCFW